MNFASLKKYSFILSILVLAVLVSLYLLRTLLPNGPGPNFPSGNGRIEAIEIDIATKVSGRIEKILVNEGAYVQEGQALVQMQVDTLHAQRDEALAREQQAIHAVASAQAQHAARLSDLAAAEAVVVMHESDLNAAKRKLARTTILANEGASSKQELDDDQARAQGMQAKLNAARAQAEASRAAVTAALAQVTGSKSLVIAAEATTKRIEADIKDSLLKAPRAGRVQIVIAHEGEVLAAGGKVLNLVDLHDVYMSFFLPEVAAGQVRLGAKARIVLDSAPSQPLPATVTFISNTAQFTPKTVETTNERQKLMFRVKAKIDQSYIDKNTNLIKTGMPGVAWLQLDPSIPWPAELELKN